MGRPLPAEIGIIQSEHNVILGMPGPWAENIFESSDHYTTKIGGLPDWPMPAEEVNCDLLKCGICGDSLVLVAQIYAPLTIHGMRIDERTIYVFGCPSSSCGISPLSWRTLRVQKVNDVSRISQVRPQSSVSVSEASSSSAREVLEEDACDAERISSEVEQQGEQDDNDWWEDDSWQPIMQRGDEDYEDFFGLEEIERVLLDVGYGAVTNSERRGSNDVHDEAGGVDEHENFSFDERLDLEFPALPCFYIYSQNESNPSGINTAALRAAELFESRVDGSTNGAEEAWEGEEYEHDRALSADRTYLKFKKKLDCNPEQCFRYCFGGRPLWANKDRGESGFCSLCGGPRIYELQLMPPLLYYLQHACRDLPTTCFSPNDWEWLTLIVCTCAQSCTQAPSDHAINASGERRQWIVIEEATILQYET